VARQRDYKAEYARRQARSRSRYGVSYNEFRTLQAKAKDQGIKPDAFRLQAFKEGTTQGNLSRIRRILDAMSSARDEMDQLRGGIVPDSTEGRTEAADLYDAWHDEFDVPDWFFYN